MGPWWEAGIAGFVFVGVEEERSKERREKREKQAKMNWFHLLTNCTADSQQNSNHFDLRVT